MGFPLQKKSKKPSMQPNKDPKAWACFTFYGSKCRPNWISEESGLVADFQVEEPEPIWQLNSRLPAKSPLSEHLWDILRRVAPVRKIIKEIASFTDATIYASVEFSGPGRNGVVFEKRLLLLLGELGIAFELMPWDGDRL